MAHRPGLPIPLQEPPSAFRYSAGPVGTSIALKSALSQRFNQVELKEDLSPCAAETESECGSGSGSASGQSEAESSKSGSKSKAKAKGTKFSYSEEEKKAVCDMYKRGRSIAEIYTQLGGTISKASLREWVGKAARGSR